jgi:hypothetical protein
MKICDTACRISKHVNTVRLCRFLFIKQNITSKEFLISKQQILHCDDINISYVGAKHCEKLWIRLRVKNFWFSCQFQGY